MRQKWTDYRVFWREFRQTRRDTGAMLPSGRALARALTRYVRDDPSDREPASKEQYVESTLRAATAGRNILEVGAGTGAVTAQIMRAMRPADRLTLVERNAQFVARLRVRLADEAFARRAGERITLRHADIEDLAEDEPFDLIISGLPLNNFTPESVERILNKLRHLLAAGGTLSFFEYVGVRQAKSLVSSRTERKRLRGVGRVLRNLLRGGRIRRDLVLANVPPAWVHHVRFGNAAIGTGKRTTAPNALCNPSPRP